MSDAKWHKLFAAVSASEWRPSAVIMKFVDTEEPEDQPMPWPKPANFWVPRQWIDSPVYGGPFELRSIEWMMFPTMVIPLFGDPDATSPRVQDFEAIRTALSKVGQFPLEEFPDGLRVIGYR